MFFKFLYASYFAYNMYLKYKINMREIKSDKEITDSAIVDLSSYLKYLEKLSETNKTDYRLYLSILHLYNVKSNISNEKYEKKGNPPL